MFKSLLKSFNSNVSTTAEAEEIRQKLQSIFFKIKTYQKCLTNDSKLNFKVNDQTKVDAERNSEGYVTYFLGGYAIRYEMDDLKSIQLFRRGKVDTLQFAELLAISFFKDIEYITDDLFVKADIYQLEILINHVVKNRNKQYF